MGKFSNLHAEVSAAYSKLPKNIQELQFVKYLNESFSRYVGIKKREKAALKKMKETYDKTTNKAAKEILETKYSKAVNEQKDRLKTQFLDLMNCILRIKKDPGFDKKIPGSKPQGGARTLTNPPKINSVVTIFEILGRLETYINDKIKVIDKHFGNNAGAVMLQEGITSTEAYIEAEQSQRRKWMEAQKRSEAEQQKK